jgi:hypothetical protein
MMSMLEAAKKSFQVHFFIAWGFQNFFAALLYSIPMELYFFAIENKFD